MKTINVTKTYLPPLDTYMDYVKQLWKSNHITNNGPLLQQLEKELSDYLDIRNIHLVNNATLGLQIALKVLQINGEVITTPFSYIASTSSIIWEQCKPVFVDIDPKTFCIDANAIEKAITKKTQAIVAVHVYGIPCDVEKIQKIARQYKLKVIYDAAHAFGITYKNKSLLDWGDISVLSFHATKLFHTVEGGALVSRNKKIAQKIAYVRNFGHKGYDKDFYGLGINGKMSEFHAAMGLCMLPSVDSIIKKRKAVAEKYDAGLTGLPIESPILPSRTVYNYAYYPVVFKNETSLEKVKKELNKNNIFPRRYFYPSLHTISYIKKYTGEYTCPVALFIAKRVLCLPLYPDLEDKDQKLIIAIIKQSL